MGDSANNPKSFLNAWCGKLRQPFTYNCRSAGLQHKLRFLCELRVEGHPYVGIGNSLNKKDAETNAARDFLQYLIRSGHLKEQDIPEQTMTVTPSVVKPEGTVEMPIMRPVFKEGEGPRDVGRAYRRQDGQVSFHMMDAQKVADAEDVDVNAGIHGNWTIDNAKSRLHQYLQLNRIEMEYVYSIVGPDHMRSFRAEAEFYVRGLGRGIKASETGSNKITASKSCALSLVRQLYHLGVIEAYTGVISSRTKDAKVVKPFETSVNPNVMEAVHSVLQELGIQPKVISSEDENKVDNDGNPIGLSLLPENLKKEVKYDSAEAGNNHSIVSFAPPYANWNPWTNCNIDEGHMATASLEQLSGEFLESFRIHQQSSDHFQKTMCDRMKLPVYKNKTEIMESISENQVLLIKGETGSGKTTQICQFILDDYIMSGQGAYCNVVVTQPRRISAISVAERVAFERGEDLGQSVGYSVRFESCLPRPYASLMFCTVGVLLRKLERGLRGVSHVIVDEIHERDVNTDFILIILRDMLSCYPDLRVILMSATIDTSLFSEYFNQCKVIQIDGRSFPVETYFLEDIIERLNFQPSSESLKRAKKKKQEEDDCAPVEDNMNAVPLPSGYSEQTRRTMSQMSEIYLNYELIVALLQHIRSLSFHGSVLIFLPGWNEIFGILKYLQEHPLFGSQSYVLLPLHSQLPRADQHRVFEPVSSHQTKIILTTNIAETSITIDDVGFVIDSCKAKIKLFTSHNNMTTFATVWASKSNLMQRKGRAGRVQKGVCYFLCSKARYDSLDANIKPEMLRTPLHEVALSIKLLNLGSIGHFLSKACDPPAIDTVIEAQSLLTDLNCLDENSDLTPLGRILAKLPVDPRLGKMIVLGTIFNCADPLAIVAAQSSNLSEVFSLGPDNKRLSATQRGFAARRHSDHFAIINAFQQWEYQREKGGEQGEIDFCNQRMLSLPSLRSTCDAKHQLLQVLIQSGFPEEQLLPCRISFRDNHVPLLDVIAAILCSGLYPNVCYHKEKRKVLTTESKAALVHKASVNCSRFEITFPYPYFVFGEKIRTRSVSCKNMSMVTPIHLLLFGSKKVELVEGFVRLDNWINLVVNPNDAAAIVALRPAIEDLITRVAQNPASFFPLQDSDLRLVHLVTDLSKMSYEIQEQTDGSGITAATLGRGMFPNRGFSRPSFRNSPPFFPVSSDNFSSDSVRFGDGGSDGQVQPEEHNDGNVVTGIKRSFDDEEPADVVGSNFIPLNRPNFESNYPNNPPPPFRGYSRGAGYDYSRPRFSRGFNNRGGNFSGGPRHRGWSPRGGGRPFRRGGGGYVPRGNQY